MMSAEKGNDIGLSAIGARIWELIETPQQVETVLARLQQEYDVSADMCRAEVDVFLQELRTHGAGGSAISRRRAILAPRRSIRPCVRHDSLPRSAGP
jgi:hypothetical protein